MTPAQVSDPNLLSALWPLCLQATVNNVPFHVGNKRAKLNPPHMFKLWEFQALNLVIKAVS